jgi:hypothetical protein
MPWALPLEEWPAADLVEAERGIGRHVVGFRCRGGGVLGRKALAPAVGARG